MPKKRKTRSKTYIKTHPVHPLSMVPIVLIVVIVPLIVRAHVMELSEAQQTFWPEEVHVDFFSYFKSQWFTVLSFISFAFMLFLYWTQRILIENIRTFWPIGVYLVFVVLSYLFADPRGIATTGYMGSYQGVFELIGYGLITVSVAYMVTSESHMKVLTGAFITIGVLVGLIGLSQYSGHDVFASDIGKQLILPESLSDLGESMEIRFGQNAIYATMYNTNFVGSFAALMIPFAFALFMRVRHIIYTPLLMVFFALMVFIAFGSNSRAGIVGISASFIVILIMFRRTLVSNPVKFLVPFALMGMTGYLLNSVSDGRIMNELESLSIREDYERAQEAFLFHEVSIHDERIVIDTEEEGLRILFTGSTTLEFETLDGETLEANEEDDRYTFEDTSYEPFQIQVREEGEMRITAYDKSFTAYMTQEGFRVIDVFGNVSAPGSPDYIEWMEPYGRMFSRRMLIWSHSLPLLKDTVLVGEGPDMYATAFPNDEMTFRMNGMSQNNIVDKPHNMYIQLGTNIGAIGLLALLFFFARYIYQSLKLYIHGKFESFSEFLGVGLLSSVVAYLVTGFFNDQRISVAPLFYIMLGLGIAVNAYVRFSSETASRQV
ncbi:MAG: O-antigen ligase family protein [Bacillota bacterium]